ncbi:hypothetical protein ACTL31_01920 [Leuconostoc mesenteroides]
MIDPNSLNLGKGHKLVVTKGMFQKEISKFVSEVYFNQANFQFNQSLNELIFDIINEDKILACHSTVFTIYNAEQQCQLTARLIKSNPKLPFFKSFGSKDFQYTEVYEFARYASTKKLSFIYTLRLFQNMLSHIPDNAVIVACIDSDLYDKFCRLSFPFDKISEPIFYLGSLTVPVNAKVKNIEDWLNKHKRICSQ